MSTAHVDWLAFTVVVPDTIPYPGEDGNLPDPALVTWIATLVHDAVRLKGVSMRSGGRFGYTCSADIGEKGRFGTVCFGGAGQRRTVSVQISGEGCGTVKEWEWVAGVLDTYAAKLTRVDLAHDDLDGEQMTVDLARDIYEHGGFTAGGRPPKARLIDDLGNRTGRTLYVGSRAAGKMLRVYEKGRQLGDPDSEWVRVEVELRAQNRELSTDMLIWPGRYLAAAYPALSYLSAEQVRIRTQQRAADITAEHMIGWLRHAAGRSITAAIAYNGGDLLGTLERITRDGWPPRVRPFLQPAIDEGGAHHAH